MSCLKLSASALDNSDRTQPPLGRSLQSSKAIAPARAGAIEDWPSDHLFLVDQESVILCFHFPKPNQLVLALSEQSAL